MNNKILKGLVAATLVVSAADVQAHTNKTFLLPRATNAYLAMETLGFREMVNRRDADKFGANFQVTGFYRGSTKKANLGKYFGINNHNNVSFGAPAVSSSEDFQIGYMIHEIATTAGSTGTISFSPKHNEYGARVDYFQELKKLVKGLYIKANMPIVHVENDMKLGVSSVTTPGTNITQANITSYFNGGYENNPAGGNKESQVKLTNALINGKHSKTNVADINVALGYRFVDKEKYNASINIAFLIPTGNGASGHYAFEPISGSKHFGLGGGLDGMIRLWGDEDKNIKLNAAVDYKYLFKANETRTLGINGYNWAPYLNLVPTTPATGKHISNSALVPAANVLTQKVGVTPNSQIDGIVDLGYNNGGFNATLGYNLFWRANESVSRKGAWTDKSYGIVAPAFDAAQSAATTNIDKVISATDLNTDAARTPSQFTNSIYGGVNYMFKNWKYPLLLGAGASYEWQSTNSAVENWMAMGKIGLSF